MQQSGYIVTASETSVTPVVSRPLVSAADGVLTLALKPRHLNGTSSTITAAKPLKLE
jgi:hypothetical protein